MPEPENPDQTLARIRDGLPRLWYSVYQGCLHAGFDETQAFTLLQTFILSQNPNGSRPPQGAGPDSNKE